MGAPTAGSVMRRRGRCGAASSSSAPRPSMAEGGANCRMCLVGVSMPRKNPDGSVVVAKMPKPQTACSLPVAEGMEVQTETEAIADDRRGILEFFLINHPLDCP